MKTHPTKPRRSLSLTMRAGGSTLTLSANLKKDGSVVTSVTTRDANKKATTRGMTERHADMAAATAHLTALAKQAEKLGWQRRAGAGFAGKPDAFSKLPAAPKVTG